MLLQLPSFLHPSLAAAAAASAAIPILVHLINRRRYRRVPWAAMSFLFAAHRQSVRRMKLQQWLLLACRTILIVLIGLAIARPYIPSSGGSIFSASPSHRIIIIDDSLSMRASVDGQTRFSKAFRAVEELVDSFPVGDGVSVITVAAPARAVIRQASYDRRAVREALAAVAPSFRSVDIPGAVELATNVLQDSDAPFDNRSVYWISDFPKHVWIGESHSSAMLEPTRAFVALKQLLDVLPAKAENMNLLHVADAGDGSGQNVAITGLQAESSFVAMNLPVRLVATVTNFGESTIASLALELRKDGEIVRREPVGALAPGRSQVVLSSVEFSRAGSHRIEARLVSLDGDALAEDDARFFSIQVHEKVPVLLVDGRPGPTRLTGQAGFIATALSPETSAQGRWDIGSQENQRQDRSPLRAKIISAAELSGEALFGFDVIALCNVQRLDEATWHQLERYVSRGGGIAVFFGDQIQAEHYNRYGFADGAGLLPGQIGDVITKSIDVDDLVTLRLSDPVHPLVSELKNQPDSGLFLARIDKYWDFKTSSTGVDVPLQFTTGDPAIVLSSHGSGRVAVFTSSANMDWNNLPSKGDYVSLMANLMAYLSPADGLGRNILVGRNIHEPLTPAESSMQAHVLTPEGDKREGEMIVEQGAVAFSFGPIEKPGHYQVSIGAKVKAFSANVEPNESHLQASDMSVLASRFDRPVRLISAADTSSVSMRAASVELASTAFYLAGVLLLCELGLAMLFGRTRTAPRRGASENQARRNRG